MRVSPAGAKQDLGQSERGGNKTQPRVREGEWGERSRQVPRPCPPPTALSSRSDTRGDLRTPARRNPTRRRRPQETGAVPVTKTHVSAGNRRSQHRGRDDDSQTAPSLRPALHLRANQSVRGRFHLQRRLVVQHTPKHLINFCAVWAPPVGHVQGPRGSGTAQVVSSTGGSARRKSQETE